MRRFELALPRSVDEALKILKDRGPDAKLLAGGTDLLPQMKNGVLKPACVVDLSGVERVHTLAGRRPGSPGRRRRHRPRPRARRHGPGHLHLARGERGAGRLRAGPQPGHARRQPLQRRALGRHGAAPAGAGRRGRHRRAGRRAAGADRRLLHGRAAHGARPRRDAGRDRRCRRRVRAAAATTCATRRGASWTSPWWAWPRSSR